MKLTLSHFFYRWLPLAALATLAAALVYLAGQQDMRLNANDPQIQLAEDVAMRLASGEAATSIVRPGQIDMAKSISPFVAVFDDSGKVVVSSATLDGQPITIPAGVFTATKTTGESRVTWQPRVGVRSALVVTHYNGASASGFVAAGRSLREVERRVDQLGLNVLLAWVMMLVLTALVIAFTKEQDHRSPLAKLLS